MSSFYGARRLLSIGHYGIKRNQLLDLQGIASIRLSPLCGVTNKKNTLLFTNILPIRLLALLSTSRTALTDGSSKVGEDTGAGRSTRQRRKWPAPINLADKQTPQRNKLSGPINQADTQTARQENVIFIGGYEFNHDREYLYELFKKFGEINKIMIPRESTYNESSCRPVEYRFAFISFKDYCSVKNAISTGNIRGPDNKIIEVREKSKRTSGEAESKRTFFVHMLPSGISIHEVHDYFQSYGDIQLVNLIIKSRRHGSPFVNALLLYTEEFNTTPLLELEHQIAGKNIKVEQFKPGMHRIIMHKCYTIFLSGMSEDFAEQDVHSHFNTVGSVNEVKLLTDENGLKNGLCLVSFRNKEDAISAAELCWHEIGACHVKAYLLGISNE